MAELGINTVRTYTPPNRDLLDAAAAEGLRVLVGLPWSQHVAFLDDRSLRRTIRRELAAKVAELGDHPAILAFALGNEIPAGVVRWHGRVRVERFLHDLYDAAKKASPKSLFTYVNFPPTEFLDLSFFDICAFNRLPAPRARAAGLPGSPPAHRRAEADAARRGGRRQHPRGRNRPGRHHRDARPRGVRRGRLRRHRVRVDRRMVARRPSGRRLEVRPRRSRAPPEAGGERRGRRLPGCAVLEGAPANLAPRVGGRLRLQRCGHTRRQSALARGADLSRLRNHPRQRRLEGSDQRDRPPVRKGPRHRHPQRRAERGAQRRPHRSHGRHRRVHRRGHPRRPRLADVPRAAVPELRCGRLGRAERRAARRSADGAVHRARARRPDTRPARRPHG